MNSNIAHNIAPLVDEFGALKAQIAALEAKETAVRKQLVALGLGTYVGKNYVVKISEGSRDNLDMTAVRDHLSAQFVRAHTTTSTFPVLHCKAKTEIAEGEAA